MIPLAPLDLGAIFNGAFATVGRYWKQLFGIGAVVYGAVAVLVATAILIAYASVSGELHAVIHLGRDEDPTTEQIVPLVVAFGVVWLVCALVAMVSTAMMYAAVPAVLQDAVLGRPVTFGAVWRRATSRLPAVIGTVLLVCLIVFVPVLLLMGAVVATMIAVISMDNDATPVLLISVGLLGAAATGPLSVWLAVKFSLAPTAAVFEEQRPVAALRRSALLVRGEWWRVFGITALAGIVASAVSYFVQLPFSFFGMLPGAAGMSGLGPDPDPVSVMFAMGGYLIVMAVGLLVSQFATSVLPPLVTGLLYVDRRIRTEDLAPVLVEAAASDPPR
ncbi:hypothetical protein ACPXCE_13370 [Streptomyces sp. DT24]|uniref:hypothetical protein n=1 Tax=Streptomyces sp. DT24 TaxID=3416520 RepID=UPI003CE7D3F1